MRNIKLFIMTISLCMFISHDVFADLGTSLQSRAYDEINNLLYAVHKKTRSPFIETEFTIVIKSKAVEQSDVRIWLAKGDQLVSEGKIDTKGNITLPVLNEKDLVGVKLHINKKDSDVGIRLSAGMKQLESLEVSYRDLFLVLDDTNEIKGDVSGLLSWFIPDMDALGFDFDEHATIEIKGSKVNYLYETDDNNRIEIELNRQLMIEDPVITFSKLPTWTWPED